MILCHVGRLELRQNGNLLDNILDLIFRALDIDNLDRNGLTGSLVDAGGTTVSSCDPAYREDRWGWLPFVHLAEASASCSKVR